MKRAKRHRLCIKPDLVISPFTLRLLRQVGKELNQGVIDAFLVSEPNIPDNVVLAVSVACCRAGAAHKEQALHE